MSEKFASRREPVPGYRLVERLGRGGFGEVWKVEAPGGFHKAMKLVFGDLGDDDPAAKQELRALNRILQIRHPFILTVERYDVVDGELVITMELADRNLEDRFKECKAQGLPGIPRDELMRYMTESAEALDLMAVEYGLQHLDIKPTNIFLVRNHVKVGDFGLVKELSGEQVQISGGMTPLYAPPESYDGFGSRSSDQYALALVYHEMLTGVRAIDGATARELMYKTVIEGPNLSSLQKSERAVVARALHRTPGERYPSCTEFVEALRALDEQPTSTGKARRTARSSNSKLLVEPDQDEADSTDLLTPAAKLGKSPSQLQHLLDPKVEPNKEPSKPRSCTLTGQLHRPNVRMVRAKIPAFVDAENGSLQPTLILGLGRTGIRLAERCWLKLRQRFGAAASKLPVQFLHIDSDPNVLHDLAKAEAIDEAAYPRFLACRLRRASDYKSNWDANKNLSSWLDSEQLLKIGPTGESRALRTLGRLAFVDNYSRIAGRMIFELDRLTSAELAQEAFEATSLRYRSDEVRVVVLAGMAGGTGSGMAVDAAFLAKSVLLAAGIEDPEIMLCLSANGSEHEEDAQHRVNQFALANDLVNYWNPQQTFTLPAPIPGVPETIAGPPATTVLLLDPHATHIPEPNGEVATDAAAEFLAYAAASSWGKTLDERLRMDPPFQSAGFFALASPSDFMLRATANDLCNDVIARWLEPADDAKSGEVQAGVRTFLEKQPLAPSSLAERLERHVARLAPEPFAHAAARAINELMETLRKKEAKSEPGIHVRAVRTKLRLTLGPDPVDDAEIYTETPAFVDVYKRAAEAAAGEVFAPIRRHLETLVENVDRRFDVVRAWWIGLSNDLGAMYERFQGLPKGRELENAAYEAAYRVHSNLVLGAMPRDHILGLEQWVKAKLEFQQRQQLAGVYLALKSMMQAFAVELSTAPRKLEAVAEHLKQDAATALAHGLGFVQQPLFAGGLAAIEDAVADAKARLGEDRVDLLESALRDRLLGPAGGVWKLASDPNVPADVLAEELSSSAARWIAERVPVVDAAQAFLDRHATPESMPEELQQFFDWSSPSLVGRPASTKAADQTEVQQRLVLVAPISEAGRTLTTALRGMESMANSQILGHAESEVVFLRLAAHESLGRMLPMRVLKARPAFELAKQMGCAEIFPVAPRVTAR